MYSIPSSCASGLASRNARMMGAPNQSTSPISAPAQVIIISAQVNILLASFSSCLPRAIEIGTADPTATRSEREKLIITKGNAILIAAKAVSPRIFPMKIPSKSPKIALASILIAPGIAAIKKRRVMLVFKKNSLCSIFSSSDILPIYYRQLSRESQWIYTKTLFIVLMQLGGEYCHSLIWSSPSAIK